MKAPRDPTGAPAAGAWALTLALGVAALAALPSAAAHGAVIEPAARNWIHYTDYRGRDPSKPESWWNYNWHSNSGGGVDVVSNNQKYKWPQGIRPYFCGDPPGQPEHEAGGRFATGESWSHSAIAKVGSFALRWAVVAVAPWT